MRLLILFTLIIGVLSSCPKTPEEAINVTHAMELTECVGSQLAYYFIENGCCVQPEDPDKFKRCSRIGAAAYLRDIDLKTYCLPPRGL